jgi:hypothetical protein
LSAGPTPLAPEIEWQVLQPSEVNSVLPLATRAADGAPAAGGALVVLCGVVLAGVVGVVAGVVCVGVAAGGAVATVVDVLLLSLPPQAARATAPTAAAASARERGSWVRTKVMLSLERRRRNNAPEKKTRTRSHLGTSARRHRA